MQAATSDVRKIEDLMRIARSLEAVEGEETGRGRVRRGPSQALFTDETDGSESEATRIADQIWAKIGPELRQSRDPKHRPPTPGPQRVRSAERTTTPPVRRDASTKAKREKSKEKERGRSPSTEMSRSRSRDGPSQCYKCKGFGHVMRDCPSLDFYTVGPNGLPVKRRDVFQERQKPRDPYCRPPFKLGQGRAEGPRHDPPPKHASPEWGPKEKRGDVHNEAVDRKLTVTMTNQSPESIQETAETSQTCLQASTQTKEADMHTSKVQCDPQTTSKPVEKGHHRGWLVPVTINQVATMALLDTGATCTLIGRLLYELLQAVQPLKVKQDENLCLEVIGGGAAPTLGTATVQVGIVGGSYEHEIVISANRENPNCILSSDFFCQHDCELSMRKQQFQVGDRQVRCVPEPSRGAIAGLKTARRVELPARTEVIVPCKPTHASS